MRKWVGCWVKGVDGRHGKMVDGLRRQNGWLHDFMGIRFGYIDALFVGNAGG